MLLSHHHSPMRGPGKRPGSTGGAGGGAGGGPGAVSLNQPNSRSSGLSSATGALGKERVGTPLVAASMKLRQAKAGNEPPVALFIGVLSSLPNHTPATRSPV